MDDVWHIQGDMMHSDECQHQIFAYVAVFCETSITAGPEIGIKIEWDKWHVICPR